MTTREQNSDNPPTARDRAPDNPEARPEEQPSNGLIQIGIKKKKSNQVQTADVGAAE